MNVHSLAAGGTHADHSVYLMSIRKQQYEWHILPDVQLTLESHQHDVQPFRGEDERLTRGQRQPLDRPHACHTLDHGGLVHHRTASERALDADDHCRIRTAVAQREIDRTPVASGGRQRHAGILDQQHARRGGRDGTNRRQDRDAEED